MEEKTHKDFEWRLTTAMGHFGNHRVDEIDAGVADDFVEKKRPLDWRDCSAIRSSDAPTTHLAATYGVSDAPRSPGMAQDTTRRRT